MKNNLIYELRKGLYEFSCSIQKETADWNFKVLIIIPHWRYTEFHKDFSGLSYTTKTTSLQNEIDGQPYIFDRTIQYIEYQKIPLC